MKRILIAVAALVLAAAAFAAWGLAISEAPYPSVVNVKVRLGGAANPRS